MKLRLRHSRVEVVRLQALLVVHYRAVDLMCDVIPSLALVVQAQRLPPHRLLSLLPIREQQQSHHFLHRVKELMVPVSERHEDVLGEVDRLLDFVCKY